MSLKKYNNLLIFLLFCLLLVNCNKRNNEEFQNKITQETFKKYETYTGQKGRIISVKKEKESDTQLISLPMFPEFKKIMTRKKLLVGLNISDLPPFIMTDANGNLSGLDIEISKKIGARLGVKVEYVRKAKNINELTQQLINGEIDIAIGKLSRTFDRLKYINFSQAYAELNQALIINKFELTKLKIEDNPYNFLKNNKTIIGVLANTAYSEFGNTFFPKAIIVEFDNWEDMLNALKQKKIFAILYDNNEVVRLARLNPEIALTATIYVLTNKKDTIGIAVAPQNDKLLNWINLFLEVNEYNYNVNKLIEDFPEIYTCK